MRAPGFWYRRPGLISALLAPLAVVWKFGHRRRMRKPGYRAAIPVICIGNLTVGGTGKTPVTIAIIQMLMAMGVAPVALSRGYGGQLRGPLQVDPATHTASDTGDEPLLLSAFAPTWISADRAAAARALEAGTAALSPDMIIMDDGHQNPDLVKDVSMIVIDAETGFGNGRVLPSGPLREPVAGGLERADLAIVIGRAAARAAFLADADLKVPFVEAELLPLETGIDWAGQKVVAFAGIGRPEKFFATLRDLGADIVATHGFGDHAEFGREILTRMAAEARAANAQLVTTEKDAVRLPDAFRREVITLPVRAHFIDDAPLRQVLDRVLG